MNKDQLEGKWKQLKGSLKEQWGKLTDDDIANIDAEIDGKKDRLIGKLQERYGYTKEQAEKAMQNIASADEWTEKHQSA